MGRRIQDPVGEFSGLCVDEEELLCLRLHPRQVTLSRGSVRVILKGLIGSVLLQEET